MSVWAVRSMGMVVSDPLVVRPWPERSRPRAAREPQSVVTATATGTPFVTMS